MADKDSTLAALREELVSLQKSEGATKSAATKCEGEMVVARRELEELRRAAADRVAANAAENEAAAASVEESKRLMQEARAAMEASIAEVQSRFGSLLKAAAASEADALEKARQCDADLAGVRAELSAAAERAVANSGKNASHAANVARMAAIHAAEVQALEQRVAESGRTAEESVAALDGLGAENAALRLRVAECTTKFAQLQFALANKDSEIDVIRAQLSAAERNRDACLEGEELVKWGAEGYALRQEEDGKTIATLTRRVAEMEAERESLVRDPSARTFMAEVSSLKEELTRRIMQSKPSMYFAPDALTKASAKSTAHRTPLEKQVIDLLTYLKANPNDVTWGRSQPSPPFTALQLLRISFNEPPGEPSPPFDPFAKAKVGGAGGAGGGAGGARLPNPFAPARAPSPSAASSASPPLLPPSPPGSSPPTPAPTPPLRTSSSGFGGGGAAFLSSGSPVPHGGPHDGLSDYVAKSEAGGHAAAVESRAELGAALLKLSGGGGAPPSSLSPSASLTNPPPGPPVSVDSAFARAAAAKQGGGYGGGPASYVRLLSKRTAPNVQAAHLARAQSKPEEPMRRKQRKAFTLRKRISQRKTRKVRR